MRSFPPARLVNVHPSVARRRHMEPESPRDPRAAPSVITDAVSRVGLVQGLFPAYHMGSYESYKFSQTSFCE